ncbi:hypothetical protein F4777DRAFT_530278 [Nemania sp. FL0916]|nr:hypothetical protein F4777DRAFT_530278 [Nemania sp. FL0916]
MQVRYAPGDRAHFSDSNDIIFVVLTASREIARSRKRKLCILYEVTVSPDGLSRRSFNALDAYEPSPAERDFLDSCDILKYVSPSLAVYFKAFRPCYVCYSGVLSL